MATRAGVDEASPVVTVKRVADDAESDAPFTLKAAVPCFASVMVAAPLPNHPSS